MGRTKERQGDDSNTDIAIVCRVCVHSLLRDATWLLSVSYIRQVGGFLLGCVLCQLLEAGLLLSVLL